MISLIQKFLHDNLQELQAEGTEQICQRLDLLRNHCCAHAAL